MSKSINKSIVSTESLLSDMDKFLIFKDVTELLNSCFSRTLKSDFDKDLVEIDRILNKYNIFESVLKKFNDEKSKIIYNNDFSSNTHLITLENLHMFFADCEECRTSLRALQGYTSSYAKRLISIAMKYFGKNSNNLLAQGVYPIYLVELYFFLKSHYRDQYKKTEFIEFVKQTIRKFFEDSVVIDNGMVNLEQINLLVGDKIGISRSSLYNAIKKVHLEVVTKDQKLLRTGQMSGSSNVRMYTKSTFVVLEDFVNMFLSVSIRPDYD